MNGVFRAGVLVVIVAAFAAFAGATSHAEAATDTQAPSVPQNERFAGTTQSTITLAWSAAQDNVAVAGYRLYLNNVAVGTTQSTTYTFGGLACGTSYTVGLSAYDAAGNASDRAYATGTTKTQPCAVQSDTTAPSVPSGVTISGASTSSMTINWTAASDNVAVAGYGVYVNGVKATETSTTSASVTGLSCGTAYSAQVDAYDAAGNRSAKSSIVSGSTSACASAGNADLYLSTTGSDTNLCTQAAPCKSLSRAYTRASAGQVVELAAGSYGSQSINYDSSKTSANDVVFRPATGAAVTLGGIAIHSGHLTIRDMKTGFVDIERTSTTTNVSDVTVQNGGGSCTKNLSEGGGIFIGSGGSYITFTGGCYGNHLNEAPVKVQGSPGPDHVTFDGVTFHDAERTDSSVHMECAYIADVTYFTVRNSRFLNCAIYDLILSNLSGVNPSNVLIENNFFDATASHAGANTSMSKGYGTLSIYQWVTNRVNYTIRNNTFYDSPMFDAGYPGSPAKWTNSVITGNAGPMSTCLPAAGLTYSYNVWSAAACSATDKKVAGITGQMVDPANYDFHWLSTSAAKGAGNPGNCPATDIDGQARTGGCDAGADQIG